MTISDPRCWGFLGFLAVALALIMGLLPTPKPAIPEPDTITPQYADVTQRAIQSLGYRCDRVVKVWPAVFGKVAVECDRYMFTIYDRGGKFSIEPN